MIRNGTRQRKYAAAVPRAHPSGWWRATSALASARNDTAWKKKPTPAVSSMTPTHIFTYYYYKNITTARRLMFCCSFLLSSLDIPTIEQIWMYNSIIIFIQWIADRKMAITLTSHMFTLITQHYSGVGSRIYCTYMGRAATPHSAEVPIDWRGTC